MKTRGLRRPTSGLPCLPVARDSDRRYNVIATKWWLLGILLVVCLFLCGVVIWNVYVNAIAR